MHHNASTRESETDRPLSIYRPVRDLVFKGEKGHKEIARLVNRELLKFGLE